MTTYICNGCNRQIEFNNNPLQNKKVCKITLRKDSNGTLVDAECGMRYERIVLDEATKDNTVKGRNRSLAKKAG